MPISVLSRDVQLRLEANKYGRRRRVAVKDSALGKGVRSLLSRLQSPRDRPYNSSSGTVRTGTLESAMPSREPECSPVRVRARAGSVIVPVRNAPTSWGGASRH